LKHPGSEDIHKSAPSTIYVMARKEIAKDEEVTLSYINRMSIFFVFICFGWGIIGVVRLIVTLISYL
jgi:hypothetical protein